MMKSRYGYTSPKARLYWQNSMVQLMGDATNFALLNQYVSTVGISKDLQSNAGLTRKLDMLPTPNAPPNSTYLSSDEERALQKEIVDLQGERYTLECRIKHIDATIRDILHKLKHPPKE